MHGALMAGYYHALYKSTCAVWHSFRFAISDKCKIERIQSPQYYFRIKCVSAYSVGCFINDITIAHSIGYFFSNESTTCYRTISCSRSTFNCPKSVGPLRDGRSRNMYYRWIGYNASICVGREIFSRLWTHVGGAATEKAETEQCLSNVTLNLIGFRR